MADANGRLWISQADSDRWASNQLFNLSEPRSYCQVIAKCQQVVEKSVKAIAAALQDRFIVHIPIGYKHDAARIASALRRPARPTDPSDIQHHINRLLNESAIAEIKIIDSLVPRRPAAGALHALNTEYPFERLAGDWAAPAIYGFHDTDVLQFRRLAERVYTGARQIVTALRH